MQSLPDEILSMIFDEVQDALVMLQLVRVCKRWKRLIADSPQLWRDALYVERGLEDSSTYIGNMLDRLELIASYNDRQFGRIGLKLTFPTTPFGDDWTRGMLPVLLDFLRSVEVKTLVICRTPGGEEVPLLSDLIKELYKLDIYGLERLIVHIKSESFFEYERLARYDVENVAILEGYEEWDLLEFEGEMLQELTLYGGFWPCFLLPSMHGLEYPCLTKLHLSNMLSENRAMANGLIELLQTSAGTLEDLSLGMDRELSRRICIREEVINPTVEIRLVRLIKLHLSFDARYLQIYDQATDGVPYKIFSLSCPRLCGTVSFGCVDSLWLFQEVLSPRVKRIELTSGMLRRLWTPFDASQWIGVQSIAIFWDQMWLHQANPLQQLLSSAFLQVREVSLVVRSTFNMDILVHFIEDVTSDREQVCLQLERLSLYDCTEHSFHKEPFNRVKAMFVNAAYVNEPDEILRLFPDYVNHCCHDDDDLHPAFLSTPDPRIHL